MWHRLYDRLLKPRSLAEDDKRRELILNILLCSTIILSAAASLSALLTFLLRADDYDGVPPLILSISTVIFTGLLWLSRKGAYRAAAYAFVALFFSAAVYPTTVWGILLPQPILTCSLVIVMTGVLLSSRAAFYTTIALVVSLAVIQHLGANAVLHFNMDWLKTAGGFNDVFVYGFTFLAIALVTWLSNREIELSLQRARRSEKALRKERNSLEIKVRERTKELETIQIEKMLQLHRFAELGRFSSTLLHDLANPLTLVSLELEQLAGGQHAKLVKEAMKGITVMERYVDGARRQLRNQTEIKLFSVSDEIERVRSFLEPRAQGNQVLLQSKVDGGLELYGDSIRFNQIMANLIGNAIDACITDSDQHNRTYKISIAAKRIGSQAVITVQDNGVGIPADDINRVFDVLYTTKASDRGSGLGLAITKQAVEEAFDGSIKVTSSRQGTCFTVHLPLA